MSARQFSIGVTFLTGRYHGEEWPPSPARLFQALVGGLMTCGYREHAAIADPALRWLERQAPPRIRACVCESTQEYRIAVPNNDMDVVAWEWLHGRPADPARLRTMKSICSKNLPGDGPHVQYTWEVTDGDAGPLNKGLEAAAYCLHTLGWGIDMAFADCSLVIENGSRWEPADTGRAYAIPMEGLLDDLHSTYTRFVNRATGEGVDTHTRPSLVRMQPYREVGVVEMPFVRFLLTDPSGDKPKSIPWERCMEVAGWLRHATAHHLRNEFDEPFVQEYVEGHTAADRKAHRLSFVPIPNIYPDGRIRRVLIAEPSGARGDIVEKLGLKLGGRRITGKNGDVVCTLETAREWDSTFNRYLPRYGASIWRTVTPVILHGHNSLRGQLSVGKTERLLLRAFEMAGYDPQSIQRLAFQSAPWWRETKHARALRTPDHLRDYPRLHVEVQFARPMRGPVLAGIGRHYGIGLFAQV